MYIYRRLCLTNETVIVSFIKLFDVMVRQMLQLNNNTKIESPDLQVKPTSR
ncbi:MAG: hypothetical protein UZ08_BCD001000317 [Candidatus Parvibacillus calidus]|jgi:hypothetical protein|nr:MAG: hypothetical protein UZ08_BCD001000317 [Candidatus Parvibacillus calidus]